MGGGSSKVKRELETAEEEEARIEEIEDLQKLAEESVVARQELETETQRLTGQTNQSLNGIAERDEMIRQLEAVAKRLGKNLERAGGVIADLQLKNQRIMKHMTVNQMKLMMKERRITSGGGGLTTLMMAASKQVRGAMFVSVDGQTTIVKDPAKSTPGKEKDPAPTSDDEVELTKELQATIVELRKEKQELADDKDYLARDRESLLRERDALYLQVEILRDDCGVMKILKDRVSELKDIAKDQHEQLIKQDEKLESAKVTESFRSLAVKWKHEGGSETRNAEAVSVGALKNHLSMELAKASGWKRNPW